MTCDDISRLLPEYLVGELSEPTIRDAQIHMAHCPGCASRLALMGSVAQQLSGRPVEPPSDPYFSRFPGRVMRGIRETASAPDAHRRSRYFHRALYASAAAAAAALLVFFVWPAETTSPEEELSREIASIDLPETEGALDLLYGAEPWEALPDISDAQWIEVLSELSRESSG